ncbi:MAG: hypothetical protein U5K38_11290 [Woeseiaceae bacterium]|nr:hypothetical protein [Woeseiaceae bacterium]
MPRRQAAARDPSQLVDSLSVRQQDLTLLTALNNSQCQYLVIGGVAVQYFGCREFSEVNYPDVLIPASEKSAQNIQIALETLNIVSDGARTRLLRPGQQLKLGLPFYAEILTAGSDLKFEELYSRSSLAEKNGTTFPIVCFDDLLMMKRKIVEELRKHERDLECLTQMESLEGGGNR